MDSGTLLFIDSLTHSLTHSLKQWIFLQLFKNNLAMQSEVSVNWCPALGTVLANEEVINGLSERGYSLTHSLSYSLTHSRTHSGITRLYDSRCVNGY